MRERDKKSWQKKSGIAHAADMVVFLKFTLDDFPQNLLGSFPASVISGVGGLLAPSSMRIKSTRTHHTAENTDSRNQLLLEFVGLLCVSGVSCSPLMHRL